MFLFFFQNEKGMCRVPSNLYVKIKSNFGCVAITLEEVARLMAIDYELKIMATKTLEARYVLEKIL